MPLPLLAVLLTVLALSWPPAAPATADSQPTGEAVDSLDTPIMPLDEVRIGMKGYGLTVFRGTDIEPFPVEVVSVIHNSTPKRSVIWITSDDPRLEESGPVQGMSGSPIFLWEEGEEGQLGDGGRLIGAFAFGYSDVTEPLAGIQPIEYMREVGVRANNRQNNQRETRRPRGGLHARRTLETLRDLAARQRVPEEAMVRLRGIEALLHGIDGQLPNREAQPPSAPTPPAPAGFDGEAQRMLLPMAVGSSEVARLFGPLLRPMGIDTVATGDGLPGGNPPPGVDVDGLDLQPGSMVAVPLATGDMDLQASGTVTDTLSDGTVLSLGHAMFGDGPTALPMATGYVHFVVPRRTLSFKRGGTLEIVGSLVQDEEAAVAGLRGTSEPHFDFAPVTVDVEMPGHDPVTYNYQVIDHPTLTSTLATMVMVDSIVAVQGLPRQNTIYLEGEMEFSGGHVVEVDTILPDSGSFGLMMELMPPLLLLTENPYESLKLERFDMSAQVVPEIREGQIFDARLDRAEVRPGEEVGLTIWIRPYGEPVQQHRLQVQVPVGTPEGDYMLMVSGASGHLSSLLSSRPHRFETYDIDDVLEMTRQVLSVKENAIYANLMLEEEGGVAVGRQELPHLPSSRRSMYVTPTTTLAQPYVETVSAELETDIAIRNDVMFTVNVRRDRTNGRR